MQNKMVVDAAPTQSWGAEHSEKALLLIDEASRTSNPTVDLKLMARETADMAVPEGKHGSVSVYDRPEGPWHVMM